MAYNYAKEFLQQHDEIVKELKECAEKELTKEAVFDDPSAMQRAQHLINNLLASMAANYPEQFGEVRKRVRTWTTRGENGEWILNIGLPTKRLRGSKPKDLPAAGLRVVNNVGYRQPPAVRAASANAAEVEFEGIFVGPDTIPTLAQFLYGLPDKAQRVLVNAVPGWEAHTDLLNERLTLLDWTVDSYSVGAEYFQLQRAGKELWRSIGRDL